MSWWHQIWGAADTDHIDRGPGFTHSEPAGACGCQPPVSDEEAAAYAAAMAAPEPCQREAKRLTDDELAALRRESFERWRESTARTMASMLGGGED